MARKTAATPQTAPLSALDRRALERAIAIERERSAECRARIDDKLRAGEPWLEVAQFAARRCQEIALHLAPWECWPPAAVAVDDVDEPGYEHRGISQSAALLKRMLQAGLSRYEPDPLAALQEAEIGRQRKMDGERGDLLLDPTSSP